MNRRGHRDDPTKFLAGLMMTTDELRGHVYDVLAIPISSTQTVTMLLSRVNGADPKQLLAAALVVAREQYDFRKADLRALDASEEERDRLKTELRKLRNSLQKLLEERA